MTVVSGVSEAKLPVRVKLLTADSELPETEEEDEKRVVVFGGGATMVGDGAEVVPTL